jgi:NAD(P)-dependent dehydrogenase (short-subunit alcohol dehydrogenase family)
VANVLERELTTAGYSALVVTSPDLPPGTRGVIFLGDLQRARGVARTTAVNRQAFACAQALAASVGDEPCALITVQDTGGDFGLSGGAGDRAWGGGLSGLVKTAAQEWPNSVLKAIDLECAHHSVEDLAQRLIAELLAGGPELEVGLRADGRRTTLRSIAVPFPDSEVTHAAIHPQSTIIASGGARGVTSAALIELARQSQPRIALLGRTPLEPEPAWAKGLASEEALKSGLMTESRRTGKAIKPREIQQQTQAILNAREVTTTLNALEAAGSEAIYLPVAIQDPQSVQQALEVVRARWGAIHGIVHGAGVLADKLIRDKTLEQFDRVFSVKVDGLRNLLELTANDPLTMICLFSSVAARVGNSGQADYAMANEVLNKVAAAEARRRGNTCTVKSLNWGPWEGGMVTPALKTHFQNLHVPLIPLEGGAKSFVQEIQSGPGGPVEIVLGCDPAAGLGVPASR